MALNVYVLQKLGTAEDMVRYTSKNSRLRTPFDSQLLQWCQTLLKSVWQHFYHTFSSLSKKLTWKMSLLAIFDILGIFAETLTADYKYSPRNSDNLPKAIQMQLSKKQNNFYIHKNIFACLFSIHNTISLSCHEQVCLSGLCFPLKRNPLKHTCSWHDKLIVLLKQFFSMFSCTCEI